MIRYIPLTYRDPVTGYTETIGLIFRLKINTPQTRGIDFFGESFNYINNQVQYPTNLVYRGTRFWVCSTYRYLEEYIIIYHFEY
jgi:hypothetical protein